MKKRIRILSVMILAAALILCALLSGCIPPPQSIWVAVKSVGGDNGLFTEGQDYSFTLFFGYSSPSVKDCQIAVITVEDTDGTDIQTIVIDGFGGEKYNKPYRDASAPALELSFPAPASQPRIGALKILISCYKDETARQSGEYLWGDFCTVKYLAESGVGTIIGGLGVDELWKRRCDFLLAGGKLTRDEYQSEMQKLKRGGVGTVGHKRGVSSGWTETGLRGGGDVSFIETVDGSGISTGTFSATTDNKTVTVSYLTQLDSEWYDMCYENYYYKYKQIFSLTAETENGVETWFVLYKDGELMLSRPVSGWCSDNVNSYFIIVTASRDGGAKSYYKYTDDMTLLEVEDYYS